MKTKRLLACLLALLLAFAVFAVGCNGNQDGNNGDVSDDPSSDGSGNEDVESTGPDYDNMTMEELYELALQETGKITIYSTTAAVQAASKKFIRAYPDLADRVEYIDSDTATVADRIETEHDSGNLNADILIVKDNSGEIYHELVQYDYLESYYPAAACEHIDADLLKYGMPLFATYSPWYYNTEMFPDGCPINTWWDIVEGYNVDTKSFIDANGNDTQYWTVYTKDITSASYAALWAQVIVDGDLMAEQYEKEFGEPLEYTYHEKLQNVPGMMEFPENNGGVELFWRFTQMKITELDDGDQVVNAVDESLNGPTIGLCSGSKLDNVNSGAMINWVTGLEPYTAFLACNYAYVVSGCDNPAGSRLFIYYMIGGPDGQSGCYSEAFNGIGKWSVRDDVLFDKTPYTVEEVILKSPDFVEIYQFYPNVKAYWIQWRGLAPST